MKISTTKGSFYIREAEATDLQQLVSIHVASWNATYADYYPKPTHALREHQWKNAFALKEDNWFCYVVTKENNELVGFATGNNFSDPQLNYRGQLNKIHFLKDYHRLGLGQKLVGVVVKHFLAKGIESMILFADPDNKNIAFYDYLRGKRILDKEGKFNGAFGWDNLQELYEKCMTKDS